MKIVKVYEEEGLEVSVREDGLKYYHRRADPDDPDQRPALVRIYNPHTDHPLLPEGAPEDDCVLYCTDAHGHSTYIVTSNGKKYVKYGYDWFRLLFQ